MTENKTASTDIDSASCAKYIDRWDKRIVVPSSQSAVKLPVESRERGLPFGGPVPVACNTHIFVSKILSQQVTKKHRKPSYKK